MLISPSILAADFANLQRDCGLAADGGADMLHLDVMDGHFVPNISIGVPVVASLAKVAKIPLDVHLMIENPSKYAEAFVKAGADYLTLHIEAKDEVPLVETLARVRALGAKPGAVIKPKTELAELEKFIPLCDMVLVMTVEPGFGGQKFIEGSLERIAAVREMIDRLNPGCLLEIDGGVDETNVAACRDAGADVAVMGSAVFKGDPIERLKLMREVLA